MIQTALYSKYDRGYHHLNAVLPPKSHPKTLGSISGLLPFFFGSSCVARQKPLRKYNESCISCTLNTEFQKCTIFNMSKIKQLKPNKAIILRFLTFVRRLWHSLQAVDCQFIETSFTVSFSDSSTTEAVVFDIWGRIGLKRDTDILYRGMVQRWMWTRVKKGEMKGVEKYMSGDTTNLLRS